MSAAQKLAASSPNPKPESWDDVAKLVTMAQESEAYLRFLGLKHNPFPVSPDADVFFLPARIDSLITEVLHCIYTRKGFLVITGEVGLGKTTVSRRIMRTLDETRVETALVFNTFIQGAALLEEINRDFGIEDSGQGPQEHMAALNRFLIDRYGAGINCAIVIDDAQNLTEESLEMVRMISNLEVHAEKLVQILLVGQPELEGKLDAHALRQLKSRIVVHARMRPYSLDELKQYIAFKLNAAGSKGGLTIPESSYRLLHQLTLGNPRRLNNLMDRCLYGLFAYNTMRLTRRVILEVAGELGMSRPKVNWGRWVTRAGLPAFGVLGILAGVFAWQGYAPSMTPVEGGGGASLQDVVQARVAKEAAVAELAQAKAERERLSAELAQAQAARESAVAELAKAKAESEKAREAVARAQVVEAKALTQVANAKELSQVEAAARKKALAEAREAREQAEASAARIDASMTEAKTRADTHSKALSEAQEARKKAEEEAAEVGRKLARLQAESEAQAKALATATQVRKEAEESASAARQDAEKARKEMASRAARSEEEQKALAVAQTAREQAEKEALKAQKESEEAFKRIEAVRQEAEKAMAQTRAEAESKLAEAETAQRKAEADALQARDAAAQTLARIQAEQARTDKELTRSKTEAERVLAEALSARSKAESEAKQAREEAARAVKVIEGAKNLDQAGKEQALAQAKAAHAKAVEEREAEAARVSAAVAQAQEAARKQTQALEEQQAARKRAESEAQEMKGQAEKALTEARAMRERAAQDVEMARMDAEKARKELQIARRQMEEMASRKDGEGKPVSMSVAPEVKQFLGAYGLEAFEQVFARGLAEGWLDGAARRIEEETGLHLVSLAEPPAELPMKYALLAHGKRKLLFWKPDFAIDTFYYGHAGPEVKNLQSRLRRLGLYPHPEDGIVGRHTMSALTQYQKLRRLPVTGQPDDATLFMVTIEKGGDVSRDTVVASAPTTGGGSAAPVVRTAGKGGWLLQLGSFRTAGEASTLRNRLAKSGVDATIVAIPKPEGVTWHSVRTSAMADRGEAERVLAELTSKMGLKGFIMHVQNAAPRDAAAVVQKQE